MLMDEVLKMSTQLSHLPLKNMSLEIEMASALLEFWIKD